MDEKHFGPVWLIPGENSGIYPYCHSIYIEGAGILIDPASDRKRLAQLRQDPGVEAIWLSHWHEDHLMHLDLFDDLPLFISEPDTKPLSDLELFMDAYGIDDGVREFWRPLFREQFHFRPRKPTDFLRGGETVSLGTLTVRLISTPGHTPGHLAFFFEEPEILFLGDYDLTKFGPWYGDVESNIEETIASVKHLRNLPAKVWLTGHETGVFEDDPGDTWDQYLDVITERERKLLHLIKKPKTLGEIAEAWIIYRKPREPKMFYEFGERSHMAKHLERLIQKGVVLEEEGRYVAV